MKVVLLAWSVCICFGVMAQNTIVLELDTVNRSVPEMGFNGNTIRGPSWTDTVFNDSVVTMFPELLRYPGGNVSNYWNWDSGWFYSQATLDSIFPDTPYTTPNWYSNSIPIDISPVHFKNALDQIGAEGVFTVNMISSNVSEQMEALQNAIDEGMQIKKVELGSEFNHENLLTHITFPTAGDYARECNMWIDSIRAIIPDAEIAVVGGNRGADSTRAWRWNDSIYSIVDSADALVWHLYLYLTDEDTLFTDEQVVVYPFFRVPLYEEWRYFQDTVTSLQNYDIWMTEYNLFDRSYDKRYSNTWAHVLILAGMNNKLLENNLISMMLYHNVGGIFPSFDALDTENDFRKRATGVAGMIWNRQMMGMEYAAPLITSSNITDSVEYTNSNGVINEVFYPKLFGWKFYTNQKESAIIVNVSDDTLLVSVPSVFAEEVSWTKWTTDSLFAKIDSVPHYYTEADTGKVNIVLLPYSINVANSFPCNDSLLLQHINICEGDSFYAGGGYQVTTGVYYDTLFSQQTGCDSVVSTDLTINTVDNGISNSTQTLTANAVAASYQWLDCDNNYAPIAGETNSSFTPIVTGNYAVAVTQNACSDTSVCELVSIVNVIENAFEKTPLVYPNPTQGVLTVEMDVVYPEIYVAIRTLGGQLVVKQEFTSAKILIVEIDAASGIYIMELQSVNMKYIGKVTVE